MTFFIHAGSTYIYLQDAIDIGLISVESLISELQQLNRNPEAIISDKADYYWLDYFINGHGVYVYAGGNCDTIEEEIFIIDDKQYSYTASGCLNDNILYMRINREYVSVSELILTGVIEGKYLIPLLKELP